MKFNPKDPETWISRDLFESYCGSDSEKILCYYDKAVQKKNVMALSMNWLASFIFPAWLGYKKQWLALAALAFVLAAIPFVEGYFNYPIPTSAFAGIFLAFAFLANGILLMGANSIFIKLKKRGMDLEQIRSALKNKASSSVVSAIVGAVSFVLFLFVVDIVAAIIFGPPV